MNRPVDVAIIGAGPYGLSLGAHLSTAPCTVRQVGLPMDLWRTRMPVGMFLKSQGFASNLSSPDREHTLEAFCSSTGRPYASYGLPVALDTFVAYGAWFREELVPDVEETRVSQLAVSDGGFELTLETGERFEASNVVVAAGVEHFAVIPEELAGLPPERCTHSSAHDDLRRFAGSHVVVIGAGQSAIESAALLHEGGADVELVARTGELAWNGPPLPLDRPLLQRLREPEAGLGSGWKTWFYSCHPELYRFLPEQVRIERARHVLGPAGAAWLPERVLGRFPVRLGLSIKWAKEAGAGVAMGFEDPTGDAVELRADHVIAATGYRSDLGKLQFLPEALRGGVRTVANTPRVDASYQSSVRGLYFIGPIVAPSFGPVMRFVYGADHAATTVGRRFGARTPRGAQTRAAVR